MSTTPSAADLSQTFTRAAQEMRRKAGTYFATLGWSVAAVRFMVTLESIGSGARMSDIGTALGVTPRAVTALADTLEGDGLVARTPARNDRRTTLITITPAGWEHIEKIRQHNVELAERTFQALDESERTVLMDFLHRLMSAS
ncbi:MarR family winged helix-turn-helix transcriptional regulator [Fodinicola feengrottensis]|uniref:HTH marR-type domain-containing protein n=1 Tax=Fodinicola feengrottensis TaxID=435914 RepID=A0ABN2I8Z7_9ACTN|nr:MarR family transcriptional regulator [Fodinicola feengrottensis]